MHEKDMIHHEDCLQSYTRLFTDIIRMKKSVQPMLAAGDIKGLADLNYCVKVCEKMMDELRKAYKNVRGSSEQSVCFLWIKQEEGNRGPVRTEYCTVSPDLRIVPKVPSARQDPGAYVEFCMELGLPQDVAEFGVFSVAWPELVEYTTWLATQGQPLPKGAEEKMQNIYTTRVLGKKPISSGAETLEIYDDGECGVVRVTDTERGTVNSVGVQALKSS